MSKPSIPQRYSLDWKTLQQSPVPSETWEWDRQRHIEMGDFARKLLAELGAAEAKVAELADEIKSLQRTVNSISGGSAQGLLVHSKVGWRETIAEQAATIAELKNGLAHEELERDIARAAAWALKGEKEEQTAAIAELRSEIEQADQALKYVRSERDFANADHRAVADMNRDQAATIERLTSIKSTIDYRLNDYLCEMKPAYDDSITGFNEAWDIVRKAFADAALSKQEHVNGR